MNLTSLAHLVGELVGGLGIFLLGMKFMSEGMRAVAGNSLRRLISTVTGNRFCDYCWGYCDLYCAVKFYYSNGRRICEQWCDGLVQAVGVTWEQILGLQLPDTGP